MKFIGMILRYMSLMSLANRVMSVENLSPPDADTAVAGDGAVVERAWVADSRFVSSDSTYAVICRMGGSRVILDSNVLVSAFTSLEGASRQLSRLVLSGSAEAQIPVPLFAEYEASVSRPMIQQRCPLPPAEQTRLFDAFRSRTQLIELYCRWLHKLARASNSMLACRLMSCIHI